MPRVDAVSDVAVHYEELLARHYTWMLGDFDELVAEQHQLLEAHGASASETVDGARIALDLGCGSGIQSVALAQLGYDTVLGVDLSRTLLAELESRALPFPAIRGVHADICAGLDRVAGPQTIATAVCMGDTLPHLPDAGAVRRLFDDVVGVLRPGGLFILSFRDLTARRSGLDRFIPVRADPDRIMTCFLEDEGDAVRVHDLIHSKTPEGTWRLDKSSYRKLRLAPSWVTGQLAEAGFGAISVAPGPRGSCTIAARGPQT